MALKSNFGGAGGGMHFPSAVVCKMQSHVQVDYQNIIAAKFQNFHSYNIVAWESIPIAK